MMTMQRTRCSRGAHAAGRWADVRPWLRFPAALGLSLGALLFLLISAPPALAEADLAPYPTSGATCSSLAADRTATNGPTWGRTILPGHDAPGGWFGVDVCSNGTSSPVVTHSSVSCDRLPANWQRTGCAPGVPTSDGFGWTFQCPELVVRFAAWAFGDSPGQWGRASGGNAPDLWLPGNYPTDFVAYANGSSHAPVPGDILVWGALDSHGQPWPAGPGATHDGHIAVVAAVRNGMVVTAEQNVKWGDADHPSDTLALTHAGAGWIVSGSGVRATALPTYRWQRTMGTARGTYGWLHSVRYTGVFPSGSHATATSTTPAPARTAAPTPTATRPPTPTPTAPPTAAAGPAPSARTAQAPVDLPSLASAAVVTGGGTLADLVWSDPGSDASAQGSPVATGRSLAAPGSSALVAGQDPAVVSLASGARYVFAVGQDGHLYQARTDPDLSGVAWSDLGAPDNVHLSPSPTAATYAGGMAVAARAVDGSLWWRAGVPGSLGAWMPIGTPAEIRFTSSLVLIGAPGGGSPLLLGLGADGRLYEREWLNAGSNQDGQDSQPAWTAPRPVAALPGGVRLIGHLAWVAEPTADRNSIGDWSDTPIDLFALDTTGALWRVRSVALATGWTVARAAPGDGSPRRLLSAAPVSSPADNSAAQEPASVHIYVSETSATYRYAAPLTATSGAGQQRAPEVLPALSGIASDVAGAALTLGHGQSAVILPGAREIDALAGADALTILGAGASGDSRTPTSPIALGGIPQGAAFSDALVGQSLDPRWLSTAASQHIDTAANGTALVAPAGGDAGLLQSVTSPAMTLVVHAEVGGNAKDANAGIRFAFGTQWAALQVGGDGRVQLCIAHGDAATQCSAGVSVPAGQRGAWLKLSLHDNVVTGWESQNDTVWVKVDSQQLDTSAAEQPAAGTASQVATPAAGPASPALVQSGETLLRYTELEVFVRGKSQDSARFYEFRVDPDQDGRGATIS